MSEEVGNIDAFSELGVVKDRTYYDVAFSFAVQDITGVKHTIKKRVVVGRIFRKSSIQYDHFKIISFQFHYWIADLGTTDSDSYQKMEMFKAYDRDGVDINHTKETIQSCVNCKFRRLQPGKHYVQTIRPQYLQTKYTGSVAGR